MTNKIFIIYILQFILFTHGQTETKFFRKDYTYFEKTQSFYKFFDLSKTWLDAFTTCAREGATLFYAEDEHELNAVLKFWTQPRDNIFIGVSSFFSKGVFTSVDNRPLMDFYHNWYPGEPNDITGDEDCIVMHKKGTMKDISCVRKFPFICKKTLANIEWHGDCQTPYKDYVANVGLNRCYKFYLTPMNWTEAFAVCNAEESYLAIINSKEEANYLKKVTEDAPKHNVKGDYIAGVVMLGFYKWFQQGWLSIKGTTLENNGYSKWGSTQPGIDNKNLCGSMFYNGELTYGDCSQQSFFICEKEIPDRTMANQNIY